MRRVRLRVKERSQQYYWDRQWFLHELRTLRAKRKYGAGTTKDIKKAQRELARIRKEEHV